MIFKMGEALLQEIRSLSDQFNIAFELGSQYNRGCLHFRNILFHPLKIGMQLPDKIGNCTQQKRKQNYRQKRKIRQETA